MWQVTIKSVKRYYGRRQIFGAQEALSTESQKHAQKLGAQLQCSCVNGQWMGDTEVKG
jgi:hypothetical protein